MDITALYRELVRLASTESAVQEPTAPPEPDAVTQQTTVIADRLAGILESIKLIRPRYLALAPPQQLPREEREEFDQTVRQLLEHQTRLIRALEQKEGARANERPVHGISRWLSDPRLENCSRTLSMHRQGMFIYLNTQLHAVSQALAEMQQVQLARNAPDVTLPRESVELDFEPVPETAPAYLPPPEDVGGTVQVLVEEHDTLLNELNFRLDQAQQAEQSLRAIGELQSELAQHLSQQSEQLERMALDVLRTEGNVAQANAQLEKAKHSNRRASRIIIYSSLATGVLLLLLNGK